MNGNEYQKLAMRTNDGKATLRVVIAIADRGNKDLGGILNACLGLSGEVGELNDLIKKSIFHEKEFDEGHAKKELSDCLWYVAMMCESFGWSMDDIMQINIDKLKARYPESEGFTVERANNRAKGDI